MRARREFTSSPSRMEMLAALVYLVLHVGAMPFVLTILMDMELIADAATANLIGYAFGTLVMLIFMWRFLRREFDSFCDRKGYCFAQIGISYGFIMASNFVVNGIMMLLGFTENPNNGAIFEMARTSFGKMAAMAVFLAPIVEELIFRAGLFNFLRRYNRVLAYAVNMLVFSACHVWGYATNDPMLWVYVVPYMPLAFILCRCYERSNSIWSNIFLHMLVNGVSMLAMRMLSYLEPLMS